MSEEKDKCETCEHRRDSSNEYCGSCGAGVESNWKEAGWRKDEKIKSLESRLKELEHYKSECLNMDTMCASLESRLKEAEIQGQQYLDALNNQTARGNDLALRLSQAEADLLQTKKEDIASMKKYADMVISLESRLSQAEAELAAVATEEWDALKAENQVLRDENVAYNKNYLKLMDVAGKMAGALDGLLLVSKAMGFGGSAWDKAKQALAEWDGIK